MTAMTLTASLRSLLATLLLLTPVVPASAVVLEGTGIATIRGGDMDTAREEAHKAALRDVALQYDARIRSEDTVEEGNLCLRRRPRGDIVMKKIGGCKQ